jgi:hypothetical protein
MSMINTAAELNIKPDSPEVELVPYGKSPATPKERLKVIQQMHAHTGWFHLSLTKYNDII